jgi:hypothetical protein
LIGIGPVGKDFLVVRKFIRIVIARVLSEVRSNAFIRINLESNTDRVARNISSGLFSSASDAVNESTPTHPSQGLVQSSGGLGIFPFTRVLG